MGVEQFNLINLTNLQDERSLNETLQQELTDMKRYANDYKLFNQYCHENNKQLDGQALMHYLHYSLKEQQVKKSTFNRRYFAIKKSLSVHEGATLTNEQMETVKELRKHFNTNEHAKQNKVEGKSAVDSVDLLAEINKLDNIRARAIMLVQFYTGNRTSEMPLLKVNDFNLKENTVNVHLKKQRKYVDKALPLDCINEIKRYIREYELQADDYFVGSVDKHGNYKSKEVSTTAYNAMLNKWIELTAYNFRKSLVSHMHRNGADTETIIRQSGHSSTKTVTEHYLKVDTVSVRKYL
jgi:integrase/recombinase XerC